jgi:uncharacterized protein (TIGR02246 family)
MPPTTSDDHAVRTVIAAWLAATKAGDLATIASLMTDDVVFLTPGRQPFGKAEFLAQSQRMAGVKIDGTSTIEELHITGNTAYLRAKLDLTMTPPNGAAFHKTGYTLTILRKEGDGRWRLARDANLIT